MKSIIWGFLAVILFMGNAFAQDDGNNAYKEDYSDYNQSGGADMNTRYKKEWIGESGYCNCLLTTMCRIPISTITLQSNEEAPNLEELASSRKETAAWLAAQQISYKELDANEVIRILTRTAQMNIASNDETGQLATIVVGDDGTNIEKNFTFEFQKQSDDVLILKITLDNP